MNSSSPRECYAQRRARLAPFPARLTSWPGATALPVTPALRTDWMLVAVWYYRGIDLMAAARLPDALAGFDCSIELKASDAQAHNNRGLAKLRLDDAGSRGESQGTHCPNTSRSELLHPL